MRDDVKDLLDRAAGWYEPPHATHEDLERRLETRRRRGRVTAAAVALAVFTAAGTLTWSAFSPSRVAGPGGDPTTEVTVTVHGVTATYPRSWVAVDLWPLARSIASWPDPVGTSIDVPESTPERGGLPLIQVSNRDLGVGSVCGTELMPDEALLYVALNGGPYQVDQNGSPIWSHQLSPSEGPCGEGWYAYRASNRAGDDGTTLSTPYFVFAAFGPRTTPGDRDALFRVFESLSIEPFDHLRPPVDGSPAYVVEPEDERTASDHSETMFFPTWSGDERPAALISGVLVERDDCLFLATGVDDVLLLWDESYRYAGGAILDESGSVVARPGDVVQGGGGYGSDWAHAEEITGTSIPERCRPNGVEPYALIYEAERVRDSVAPTNWDIGLGFPVCNVSRVHGDFGSGPGTAFVATRMSDSGCPATGDGFQFLGVDASGDGIVDGSFGPLECQPVCRAFAAPDLDADGVNEVAIAVGSTGGSTLFKLFGVAFASIQELRFDCVDCGQLFSWGRPGGHAEGAYCPAGEAPGDFASWAAEQTDDSTAYAVVEVFIDVKGSFLTQVDRRDSQVPFEESALPPGGGDDFCGAPVSAVVH